MKDPFPLILKYKIKIIPIRKKYGVGALYQIRPHNAFLILKSKAEGPTHLPIIFTYNNDKVINSEAIKTCE